MNKLIVTILTVLGIMYAYNVFADKTPESYGCDTSDSTECYVLIVGGNQPYDVLPGINKWEIID
jgi:hypothetical protein